MMACTGSECVNATYTAHERTTLHAVLKTLSGPSLVHPIDANSCSNCNNNSSSSSGLSRAPGGCFPRRRDRGHPGGYRAPEDARTRAVRSGGKTGLMALNPASKSRQGDPPTRTRLTAWRAWPRGACVERTSLPLVGICPHRTTVTRLEVHKAPSRGRVTVMLETGRMS